MKREIDRTPNDTAGGGTSGETRKETGRFSVHGLPRKVAGNRPLFFLLLERADFTHSLTRECVFLRNGVVLLKDGADTSFVPPLVTRGL